MAPSPPSTRDGFHIAIICALSLEADMVESVFDSFYEHDHGKAAGDLNTYTTGVIGNHNVVLAYMPGMGITTAASVAAYLRTSFRRIQVAFVAGICGVIPYNPDTKEEIILGDCVISTAVIQYDFGRQYAQGFMRKNNIEDTLGRATPEIRSMISMLKTKRNRKQAQESLLLHLKALQQTRSDAVYPGSKKDILFGPLHVHKHDHDKDTCTGCSRDSVTCSRDCDTIGCMDRGSLVPRQRLEHQSTALSESNDIDPVIHFGRFGSANTVMKSGSDRNRIAQQEELIAFEMEGSGVWDNLPTIIIKSACDYADSHKNKEWQEYAAATAAACVKAVLERWQISDDLLVHEATSSSGPFYAIPNLSNPRFTGRGSDLEELHERFIDREGHHNLAIYGLGGIGKSQLGLAFCQKIKTLYPDMSIFWISALSIERYKQDLGRICQTCSLSSGNGESYITARQYLSSLKAGKWLLLVDNADERAMLFNGEENIIDSLPRSATGFTVFTTRYKDIAVDLTAGNVLRLDEMSLPDARIYFIKCLKFAKAIQDEFAVDELLLQLTCLPLAITQAAAYIMKTSITIRKYLELMKKNNDEAIKLLSSRFRDNTREKTAQNAVAVTWLISFESIINDEPKAADILFFISFIENNRIPLSILPPLESEVELREAIGILIGYSFLIQHEDEDKYDMHRLVHLAIKTWARSQQHATRIQDRVIRRLVMLLPSSLWDGKQLGPSHQYNPHAYIPHAIHALNDSIKTPSNIRAELYFRVSAFLFRDYRMEEAFELMKDCIAWQDKMLPEDVSARLKAQNLLFNIALRSAESDVVKSIKVFQPTGIVQGSVDWFMFQETLFFIAEAQQLHAEAIVILENMCAVKQQNGCEGHLDTVEFLLHSRVRLADQYAISGSMDKAAEIFENIIETDNIVSPRNTTSLRTARRRLANIYSIQGHTEKAITLLENVLRDSSEEDFITAACMSHLVIAYIDGGYHAQAEATLERVLSITENSILGGRPYFILVEISLLDQYQEMRQYEKAKQILARLDAYSKEDIDMSRGLRANVETVLAKARRDPQLGDSLT